MKSCGLLIRTAATILVVACTVFAQQQSKPAETGKPATTDAKDEVLILVNITADSLRFDAVPNTKVEFPGTHERTKIWVTERQNLPDQVEPGVTYRNIGLQLTISTRFAEIDRIVREALGQQPPTGTVAAEPKDQTTPPQQARPDTAAPQPTTAQPPPNKTPARPPL